MTPEQATERVARLGAEIRTTYNGLATSLRNRKDHPTYGYTKANLRSSCDRLTGLVHAWLIMTGRWDASGAVLIDSVTVKEIDGRFGFDLWAVTEQVKRA
jgi:hypothetical protein